MHKGPGGFRGPGMLTFASLHKVKHAAKTDESQVIFQGLQSGHPPYSDSDWLVLIALLCWVG